MRSIYTLLTLLITGLISSGFAVTPVRKPPPPPMQAGSWALTLPPEIARDTLFKMIKSSEPKVRFEAAAGFALTGDTTAAEVLLAAMQDSVLNVRIKAVDALGKLGIARAIPLIMQGLNHEDVNYRRTCVWTLGMMRAEAALDAIIALSYRDYSPGNRSTAIRTLGYFSNPAALDRILEATRDTLPVVRSGAAIALGLTGDSVMIEPLLMLTTDSNREVMLNAIGSIGAIPAPQAEEALLALLESNRFDVRKTAINSLVQRSSLTVEKLLPIAKSSTGRKLRALSQILAERWVIGDPASEKVVEFFQSMSKTAQSDAMLGGFRYFIGTADEKAATLIITAFQAHPELFIAEEFAYSGYTPLALAASEWAENCGVRIRKPEGTRLVSWGEFKQ